MKIEKEGCKMILKALWNKTISHFLYCVNLGRCSNFSHNYCMTHVRFKQHDQEYMITLEIRKKYNRGVIFKIWIV